MKNKLASLAKNLFLALGITAISSSLPVAAVTLNSSDVGKTFEIDWFLGAGENDNDGGAISPIDLSANAEFTLTDYILNTDGRDRVNLDVTVTNTTTLGSGITEAGITSFGFAATPDVERAEFRNSHSDTTDTDRFTEVEVQDKNQNFPGGFKNIDVCIFTQGCKGGSQGSALAAGEFDNFSLSIYGKFAEGVTFSQFPVKFQTTEINQNLGGSFEFSGIETPPEDNTIAEVPEPGMIVAIGLFTASSLLLKKRQRV